MRVKSVIKYQSHDYIKAARGYYLTFIGITVFFGLILRGRGTYTIGGYEFLTCIFLFVVGLSSFKEFFLMMLQNSISRKTMFISKLITILFMGLILAVSDRIIILIGKLLSNISENIEILGFYDRVFKSRMSLLNPVVSNLEAIFITIFTYIAVTLVGYFVGINYYKMNKTLKLFVSIGVPATLFVLLPLFDSMFFGGNLSKFILKAIQFIFNGKNPYNLLLVCVGVIAVCIVLCWLLIRRAVGKDK